MTATRTIKNLNAKTEALAIQLAEEMRKAGASDAEIEEKLSDILAPRTTTKGARSAIAKALANPGVPVYLAGHKTDAKL